MRNCRSVPVHRLDGLPGLVAVQRRADGGCKRACVAGGRGVLLAVRCPSCMEQHGARSLGVVDKKKGPPANVQRKAQMTERRESLLEQSEACNVTRQRNSNAKVLAHCTPPSNSGTHGLINKNAVQK